MELVLTPELLLSAYAQGLFPMAHSADSPYIHFVCPEMRGQLSITGIHIPKSLMRTVKKHTLFDVRIDTAFESVISACAAPRPDQPDTWINKSIIDAYTTLHKMGHAHSVECWQGGELLGGLYGIKIGSAFFGESMFSGARDASKVALVHLCARLWRGGFTVLDTQFVNDHLKQFGVFEIPHEDYMQRLDSALKLPADWELKELSQSQILAEYLEFRRAHSPE